MLVLVSCGEVTRQERPDASSPIRCFLVATPVECDGFRCEAVAHGVESIITERLGCFLSEIGTERTTTRIGTGDPSLVATSMV